MTTHQKYEGLGPCLMHSGFVAPDDYGQVRREGRTWRAHRWAAHVAHGPCPVGQVVRHKCDNKLCVHPDHLEYGTQRDNILDRRERERFFKLTREDVEAIKAQPSRTQTSLAAEYGVHQTMIHKIRTGKQWS